MSRYYKFEHDCYSETAGCGCCVDYYDYYTLLDDEGNKCGLYSSYEEMLEGLLELNGIKLESV